MKKLTLSDFGMGKRQRKTRMRRMGDAVVAEWRAIAKGKLGPRTRGTYVRSIGIRSVSDNAVLVALPGPGHESTATLALIIELGMGGGGIGTEGQYDVRQHLLKAASKNVRWGKNGPYLNVPFHRTVARIRELGGNHAVIAARELIGSMDGSAPKGGPKGAARLVSGLAPKISAHHAADPLQDIIKLVSTYNKGKEQTTGYRMWRRASWGGRPWWSKGVKARNFADDVIERLPEIVGELS